MTDELFCYDCKRPANTECKEQKHRMNTEEVECMGKEQQHSPLPWRVHSPQLGWTTVLDANDNDIIDVNFSDGADEPTRYPERENAAFVVRAVNSHEDSQRAIAYLVLNDCLKGAYWPEEIVSWAQTLMRGEQRVGIEIVRSALALARRCD